MRLIAGSVLFILLGSSLAAAFSANGGNNPYDRIMLDYLPNPFAADRPAWDPFGPDQGSEYTPGRPEWDPYSPASYDVPQLISADPFAPEQNLSIGDEVASPNQIYLQLGSLLVTEGTVGLGSPYTLWLLVGDLGPFGLYDGGSRILSPGFVSRGWYRLDRYAETVETHLYRFNTSTPSNSVTLSVSSAGYPAGYGLVGRVADPDGFGIPRARVLISGYDGGVFSTVSGGQGYYGMDVPSGTYSVTAEREGFTFSTSTARVWTGTVSAAGPIVGYAVPGPVEGEVNPDESGAAGSGWLEGVVTDGSGTPIAGATVRIDGVFSVTTDQDGGYLTSLVPGWHSITVSAAGYTFGSTSVQILAGQVSRQDIQGTRIVALGNYG